jgi:hypothetical protein
MIHGINVEQYLEHMASFVVIAYAMRTIPQPKSVWGRWLIGVAQFAISNADKGQAALAGPPASTSPAESMKP